MDQELQKLIRQLQSEKCPRKVLDRVAEGISREKTPARSLRSSLAWAVSIACLVCAVAVWRSHVNRQTQRDKVEMAAARTRANRVLVAQQTQEAVGYIGQALLRAVAHTENVLSEEAVPPLRNGFEFAVSKITKPI